MEVKLVTSRSPMSFRGVDFGAQGPSQQQCLRLSRKQELLKQLRARHRDGGTLRSSEKVLGALVQLRSEGLLFGTKDYTMVLSTLTRHRMWALALEVMEDILCSNIQVDVIVYGAAVGACRCGQWIQALQLKEGMRQFSISPDLVTFNSVVAACERGQQWRSAKQILQEMRRQALKLDEVSYSSAASACEKGKQWAHALAAAADMHTSGLGYDQRQRDQARYPGAGCCD